MVYKNSNKVNDNYLPHPLQGDFSLEASASLDLGLNLDMCMVYHLQQHCGEFQVPAQTVWKALQCGLYLQKFWIKAILINASSTGSIWMAEKRKLSRQSYFAFLSHLGLSHDDLVCVECKCKARQTERFQLRIFELSIPTI